MFLPVGRGLLLSGIALGTGQPSSAQHDTPVALPVVEIWSPRVANQESAGTFAMPVTALRFEPLIDVQSRNFAEGQSDIAIRGGTFANTGFSVGAVAIYDPQTAHYTAELPLAGEMLASPIVRVGADQALAGGRGTAGSVGFGWRPIESGGALGGALGGFDTQSGDLYIGAASATGWGVDAALATSRSAGTIENGDHDFSRANVRVQHRTANSQSDIALGYQEKFFGWPNLYTPYNSPESENLQTVLLVANHRIQWAEANELQVGAYYRRNKDDYAFDRFAAVGPVHPFQHTTWVYGAAVDGRIAVPGDRAAVRFSADASADEIDSTSLLYGRFDSRTMWRTAVFPEIRWAQSGAAATVLTAGAAYEDTNREEGAFLPMVELAREDATARWSRLAVAFTTTSQVASYTALNASTTGGLFRGNPDLGRSRAGTLDVRAEGRFAEWEVEASAFWRRDDDLVDWVFRRGVTARAAKAVDLDTVGVELFARRSWRALDLQLGYSWLHKDADYGDSTLDGSFYALNFPEHRLTAAVTWRALPGFEIRWDNEARLQTDNPLRRVGGDETLLSDLGLYWRPRGAAGWVYSLQIDNLWNSHFEEVPATPAGRRLVAVGARYAW